MGVKNWFSNSGILDFENTFIDDKDEINFIEWVYRNAEGNDDAVGYLVKYLINIGREASRADFE